MMGFSGLIATVRKGKQFWLSEVQGLNLMTQGETREDALDMIVDAMGELIQDSAVEIGLKSIDGGYFAVLTNRAAVLKALSEERLNEVRGRSWVECFCKDCGKLVYTSGSERHDADYQWICSNRLCEHSEHAEHYGDMDAPDWAGELPDNIGELIKRKWMKDKGLLQRLYEHGVNFRIEVDTDNDVVGQRILVVDLFDGNGMENVDRVLSDDVNEAAQWLLGKMKGCDPAMVEELLKEEKADNEELEDGESDMSSQG